MRLPLLIHETLVIGAASESHKAHYVRPRRRMPPAPRRRSASESHKAHYVRRSNVADLIHGTVSASESHKAHYVRPRDSYLL